MAVNLIEDKLSKEFKIEKEVSTGIYPIDLYFPDYKLGVEIDGTSHYYSLTEHEMGKSQFKYWLYDKAGFSILRMPYHNFTTRGVTEFRGTLILKEDEIIKAVRDAIEEREGKTDGVDPKEFFNKLLIEWVSEWMN